jgi:ClpX C4-type zinc finger
MSGSFSSLGLSADGGHPLEQTRPLEEIPESVEQASAPLSCTFCGLGQGEAARLFQGRAGFICDECVDVCTALIADYQEHAIAPPEDRSSWRERWFGGKKSLECSFTPHGHDNPQGERLFASPEIQICDLCIRQCAILKAEAERQG